MSPSQLRLIVGLVAAAIFAMGGFSSFAVTLPELVEIWRLDNTAAGWISGIYFAGYVVAVPILVGMTDRIDPRWIYLVGCVAGVIGGVGFALYADGLWSAMAFRAIAGIALAGTYMPGLRVLTQRLNATARLRSVPYYTSMFGVGVSLSFLVTGWWVEAFGWRWAYALGGLCSALSAVLLIVATVGTAPVEEPKPQGPQRHPLDFRPVFTNRRALAYILAYGGHSWELFACRAWMVAFLLYVWNLGSAAPPGQTITQWITFAVLCGVPSSMFGGELANRFGRVRLIVVAAGSSIAVGLVTGFGSQMPFVAVAALLVAYNTVIALDSGALTTGAVAESRPGEQGATLAVHSVSGFGGGAVGPVAFGVALDLFGGTTSYWAWVAGFGVSVFGSLVAVLAIYLMAAAFSRRGE
jgi:MFS family permease